MLTKLILFLLFIFILNVPFGYWRESVKKFSWQWFVAIHLPVILLYLVRKQYHIERTWITLIIMIIFFFSGQFFGKKIRRIRNSAQKK